MSELDALRLMVRHFPGGLGVIALRIGKTPEVLRKELGDAPGFKLGLATAMLISELCIEANSEHCRAFATVVSASSGGFIRLPVAQMPPESVSRSLASIVREMADVAAATLDADADDVISDNDLKVTQKEIGEAREALQFLERALRVKNQAGKPESERRLRA